MMTPELDSLRSRLEAFSTAVQNIPEVEEPPKTTLGIINRRQRENYWNRILRYFLDPSEPHGFGTAVLDAVLELILSRTEDAEFEYQSGDNIVVRSEVQNPNGGRPDLFICHDGSWSVCFELKVTASEGSNQTKQYVGEIPIDNSTIPSDSRYHVYLSKASQLNAEASAFLNISWRELVDLLDEVLVATGGRATGRGAAQLRDFRNTIQTETTMHENEHTEQQREQMELYVKYYDEIQTVEQAFADIHQQEKNQWAERFLEDYRPDAWTEVWNCESSTSGLIYKDGWRLGPDRNPVDDRDNAQYGLEFQHFVKKPETFTNGKLRYRVLTSRHIGDDEYREAVKQLVNNAFYDELEEIRSRHGIQHVSRRKTHAKKYYSFEPERGPQAFYETLQQAFDEFVDLAPTLTEIHEQAIELAVEE